ncbi:15292_t:CDS:2 [Cetraspora pellucida]|uniref:15292_t:CDS:1 n=1 Tax=Cetraspora pellucida TaxID=1433469 RepID=A0A9N9AXF4_9GLOM|nr:15292_t:CDS:2 [Cetraspora pellucida]
MSRSDGSEWLDNELENGNITFYKFSLFKNIKLIGQGGFGFVSSADYDEENVALKKLKSEEAAKETTKEATKKFVNEVIYY